MGGSSVEPPTKSEKNMNEATQTRLAIDSNSAIAYLGELYRIRGEDGFIITADWLIGVTVANQEFVHLHHFDQKFHAENFMDQVRARGTINPTKWFKVPTTPSLEERLSPGGLEWTLEQEELHG